MDFIESQDCLDCFENTAAYRKELMYKEFIMTVTYSF